MEMEGLLAALNIPDLWQQNSARLLAAGSDVIVDAPTGAGKTRVFELLIEAKGTLRHGQAVFTVPTRALANDKFREWSGRGWNVGLATGDRAERVNAPVLVATLETQRERILSGRAPDLLVVDEYQMIADSKRGLNYELALALLPPASRILLLSGSVRNAGDIADWLRRLGRTVELVKVGERPVPLDEMPVEQLPRVPDAIQGFWPRLAAAAGAAGLTPLLIFAPRRADAEKIARKVADGLAVRRPLEVSDAAERSLGRDLARLLRRRVAFHHSGLSYQARAGWIEPLAKNGHLDVVVATTGLAAGINFSVRSVFVAETRYFDGPYQRELRPDELLQMFGRAGRRGLDTQGTVLVAPQSPRLFDAVPRQLRRVNEIDWPTLLRVMEESAARGEKPLDAAADVCTRLFSDQKIQLGIEGGVLRQENEAPGRFDPTRAEILNRGRVWCPAKEMRRGTVVLGSTFSFQKERWRLSLRVAGVVEPLGPGRLCRIAQPDGSFHYGKELSVGRTVDGDKILPLAWVQKRLRLGKRETFSLEDFNSTLVPLLGEHIPAGKLGDVLMRGGAVSVRIRFDGHPVEAWVDETGAALLDPPTRRAHIRRETAYSTGDGADPIHPSPGSAAHAWRKLGLVDDRGVPTARGRIFSRFQGGEGLMIAAALEDAAYPVDELVLHVANLRGGHRFGEFAGGESDRLGFATRSAYGHVDYPGYLDAGLCPGYGEGTAEAIERFRSQGMGGFRDGVVDIRSGDVERATLEWLSVLRHIVHAPDADAGRWADLQHAAARLLEKNQSRTNSHEVELPAQFLQRAASRPSGERIFS